MHLIPLFLLVAGCTSTDSGDAKDTDTGADTADTQDSAGDSDSTDSASTTDADADGYTADVDCDDTDAAIHPDATEVCDGVDNDCDALVDDDDDSLDSDFAWYEDADGDKYGDPAKVHHTCEAPTQGANNGGDCDDTNAAVSPNATEVCDADDVDENCNGKADDADDELDPSTTTAFPSDSDGDGYGSTVDVTYACDGTTLSGDDCDDSNAEVNPGATETCDNGLDDDCDGTNGSCTLDGELELGADVEVKISGSDTDQDFGTYAIPAGDVNGDGNDDVWVGAPGYDAKTYGGAFLFYGPLRKDLLATDADAIVTGAIADDAIGSSLATADLDGDGALDLVVGAPDSTTSSSGGDAYAGQVYVWLGLPEDGDTTASAALKIQGDSFAAFGYRGLTTGDVNGDGVADLLGLDQVNEAVQIFTGPLVAGSYDATDALLSIGTPSADVTSDNKQLLSTGDFDGDGIDDVVVGLPNDATGGTGAGSAFVLLGGFADGVDLATSASFIVTGPTVNDNAGSAVSLGGDGNGDGYADLLVGATAASTGGEAALFYGPATGTTSTSSGDTVITSSTTNEKLGSSVAWVGDVNGDGTSDFAVGSTGMAGGSRNVGGLILMYGPAAASLDAADADVVVTSEGSNDQAGGAVSGMGDTNGDGFDDLFLDAPANSTNTGAAWFILGGGL